MPNPILEPTMPDVAAHRPDRCSLPRVARAVLLLLGAALAAPATARAQRPIEALAWMAGCWEMRAPARRVEEHWMAPRGGIMLGVSRTTRRDSLVEYETMRIFESGDTLVFAAQPSGQSPAEFRSGGVEAPDTDSTMVVFENPAHDFPQRVIYRRAGADSLVARVEGMTEGGMRALGFPYERVACPGEGERRR